MGFDVVSQKILSIVFKDILPLSYSFKRNQSRVLIQNGNNLKSHFFYIEIVLTFFQQGVDCFF